MNSYNNNNEIWIALIAAASGILMSLGFNKIIPSFVAWLDNKKTDKQERRSATQKDLKGLKDRIDSLEKKLDISQRFEIQTRTTLNAMIPLMKELMKEHPDYISLLITLEKNIIGTDEDNKEFQD